MYWVGHSGTGEFRLGNLVVTADASDEGEAKAKPPKKTRAAFYF